MTVDRRSDRRGQQVRHDNPRDVREAAEMARDRRQRAGQDCLVGRCEEHRDHDARKDLPERVPYAECTFGWRIAGGVSHCRT